MRFTDNFEFETFNGELFYIDVKGEKFEENGEVFTELLEIEINDESGDVVEEGHLFFSEIMEEINCREYEFELHETDFDYYETSLSTLGSDKFDL